MAKTMANTMPKTTTNNEPTTVNTMGKSMAGQWVEDSGLTTKGLFNDKTTTKQWPGNG